jgi:hypothetical protein
VHACKKTRAHVNSTIFGKQDTFSEEVSMGTTIATNDINTLLSKLTVSTENCYQITLSVAQTCI